MQQVHGDVFNTKNAAWNSVMDGKDPYLELDEGGTYWIDDSVHFAAFGEIHGRNTGVYARENFGPKAMLTWPGVPIRDAAGNITGWGNVGHQADNWMYIHGLTINARRGQVQGNDETVCVSLMGPNVQGHARAHFTDSRAVLGQCGWDLMNTQYNRFENLEASLCQDGFRFWNHPRWGGATDQPAYQIKPHQCEHGILFLDLSRPDLGYGLPMNGTVWHDVLPRENHNNHFVIDSLNPNHGADIVIDGGSSEYLDTNANGQDVVRTFNVPEIGQFQMTFKRAPCYVGTGCITFRRYTFNDNQYEGTSVIILDKPRSKVILDNTHGGGPNRYFTKQNHPKATVSYFGDVFTYGVMTGVGRFPDGWVPYSDGDNKTALFCGPCVRRDRADDSIGSLLHTTWVPLKPVFDVTKGSITVTTQGTRLRLSDGGSARSKWLRGYGAPAGAYNAPFVFNFWVRNNGDTTAWVRTWLEHAPNTSLYGGGSLTPIPINPGWNRVCIVCNGNMWGDNPDLCLHLDTDKAADLLAGHIALTPGDNEGVFRDALHRGLRGE